MWRFDSSRPHTVERDLYQVNINQEEDKVDVFYVVVVFVLLVAVGNAINAYRSL